MESLALQTLESLLDIVGHRPVPVVGYTIDGIAQNGMSSKSQVDADLMSPARLQVNSKKGGHLEPLKHLESGCRLAAVEPGYSHPFSVGHAAAHGSDNASRVLLEFAAHQGQIAPVETMGAGLLRQSSQRRGCLGYDQ